MDKAEKKALQERYNDISQMAFEAFATYYLCDGCLLYTSDAADE